MESEEFLCISCNRTLSTDSSTYKGRKKVDSLFTPESLKHLKSTYPEQPYVCPDCLRSYRSLCTKVARKKSGRVRLSFKGDETIASQVASQSASTKEEGRVSETLALTQTLPKAAGPDLLPDLSPPSHHTGATAKRRQPDTGFTPKAKSKVQDVRSTPVKTLPSSAAAAAAARILQTSVPTESEPLAQPLLPTTPGVSRNKDTLTLYFSSPEKPQIRADEMGAQRLIESVDEPIPRVVSSVEELATQVAKYLLESKYDRAMASIQNFSTTAKKRVHTHVFNQAASEVEQLVRPSPRRTKDIKSLHLPTDPESMSNFSWANVVEEAKENAPVMYGFLDAAIPKEVPPGAPKGPQRARRVMTQDEYDLVRQARMGMVLSVILGTANQYMYKTHRAMNSLFLWMEGASQELVSYLHFMGLCQVTGSADQQIDKLRQGHDHTMLTWKTDVERYLTANPGPNTRRSGGQQAIPFTCSFVFDNVQFLAETKHLSSEHGNVMHMRTMILGVKHRTPSVHLANGEKDPHSVPPEAFLPNKDDYTLLRTNMTIHVERALVTYVPHLSELEKKVIWHIPHRFSKEMSLKSEIANLGTLPDDPGKTSGVLSIQRKLLKYVPRYKLQTATGVVEKLLTAKIDGDQLSTEKCMVARRSGLRSNTAEGRGEGFRENTQQFHLEIQMLQDTNNDLFDGSNARDCGTLFHLKQLLNYHGLKKKVMENFKNVWNFLGMVTDAYILVMYMKHHDMNSLTDIPSGYETMNAEERRHFLHTAAARIVQEVWQEADKDELLDVILGYRENAADEPLAYCQCGEVTDEGMVSCDNPECNCLWFHYSCAPNYQPGHTGDYFCSLECRRSEAYAYCFCKKKKAPDGSTNWLVCEARDKCVKDKKYHGYCFTDIPTGAFYCSDDCRASGTENDARREYSLQVIYRGLLHRVNRDFVREGYGPGMLAMWRVNLPYFWKGNHYKYLICHHAITLTVNGVYGERLAHEFTHERTANLRGGEGSNLPLDFICELANNDFKDLVHRLRGRYTEDSIERISQMGMVFRKQMETLFRTSQGMLDSFNPKQKRPAQYDSDMMKIIPVIVAEKPFDITPGRRLRGLPLYKRTISMHEPQSLGARLATHTTNSTFVSEMNQRPREQRRQERPE